MDSVPQRDDLGIDWNLPAEQIYAELKVQAAGVYWAWMAEVEQRRAEGRLLTDEDLRRFAGEEAA
jgi:hypothetical protein